MIVRVAVEVFEKVGLRSWSPIEETVFIVLYRVVM